MTAGSPIVLLGSTSGDKLLILKSALPSARIIQLAAQSGITAQPLSEAVTTTGAANRAKDAINIYSRDDYDLSIGMEGGLEKINGIYHLVCVACIINRQGNNLFGISQKIPLPKSVSQEVEKGSQFGVAIRSYKEKLLREDRESALELALVEGLINRKDLFIESISMALKKISPDSL